MPTLAHSSELDIASRRIGAALERVLEAYGHWNARRALNKGWPMLTGMDDHILHDLGLSRIGVEVGFIQPQH